MTERFKPLRNFPGYQVSNMGRVFGPKGELKPRDRRGYQRVALYRPDKSRIDANIHILVAAHFKRFKPGCCEVDHIDGDKRNNAASNLRYVNRSENMIYMWKLKRKKCKKQ